LLVRKAIQEDIPGILKIDATSFPTCWKSETYANELAQDRSIFLVSCADDQITGFSLAWTVLDELHLLKVAVDPELRRRGIGRELIRQTLSVALDRGCILAYLEVRMNNQAAKMMYRGFGFSPLGIRKGYYSDTGEDALLLTAKLDIDFDDRMED
jgi:ribosomal-protein-alanine acetyltransferase